MCHGTLGRRLYPQGKETASNHSNPPQAIRVKVLIAHYWTAKTAVGSVGVIGGALIAQADALPPWANGVGIVTSMSFVIWLLWYHTTKTQPRTQDTHNAHVEKICAEFKDALENQSDGVKELSKELCDTFRSEQATTRAVFTDSLKAVQGSVDNVHSRIDKI